MKRLIIFLGVAAGFAEGVRASTTWYVSPAGNDANQGTSWVQAKQSIQAAVNAALDGDTVVVSNGLYLLNSTVTVTNAINLQSLSGSSTTVLDGQKRQQCVRINGATATLSGFTVQNGFATVGGGVYCNGGTIQDCRIQGNQAMGSDVNDGQGGGVYLAYGTLTNCVIASNAASSTNASQGAWGGGVYCYGGLAQDCVISNNNCSADYVYGGGVVLTGGQLRNSRVSANAGVALTGAAGGGVYATIMQLSVQSLVDACVIANNSASATDTWTYTAASANGGGLNIGNGTTVRNTLINGNTAKAAAGFTSGAGVWTSGSTLENCTVVYNKSTTQNGNLGAGGGVTWGYNDQCYNNIIWFNSADNGPDNWEVNSFSYPSFVNCDIGSYVPPTNTVKCLTTDPLFLNAAQGNFQLQAGSPCVNAGTNQAWMAGTVDLAGDNRISGGRVDLGAYEYQAASALVLGSVSRFSGNQCALALNAVAGQNYTLQYSLTLTNWVSLLTTNTAGGALQLSDTSASNAFRFYRVLVGP